MHIYDDKQLNNLKIYVTENGEKTLFKHILINEKYYELSDSVFSFEKAGYYKIEIIATDNAEQTSSVFFNVTVKNHIEVIDNKPYSEDESLATFIRNQDNYFTGYIKDDKGLKSIEIRGTKNSTTFDILEETNITGTSSSLEYYHFRPTNLGTYTITLIITDNNEQVSLVYFDVEIIESTISKPILNGGVNIVDITNGFKINSQSASGSVDEYKFYRSTSSGSIGNLIKSGSTSRYYDDTGLSNNVTYYYTIKACNSAGCDTSNQDYKKYEPPSTISKPILNGGVNIVDITNGFQINSQSATGSVDEYKFYRSTSSGSLGSLIKSGSTSRYYDDTGLSNNVTYYYTIKACNSAGCDTSNQDYKQY